jgi:hypothetical protein
MAKASWKQEAFLYLHQKSYHAHSDNQQQN